MLVGALPKLVDEEERLGGAAPQHRGDLLAVDHVGALLRHHAVLAVDAREDLVHDAEHGRLGRDEAADLGHDAEQRHLLDVDALAGEVRARQDLDGTLATVGELGVVGDEGRQDELVDEVAPVGGVEDVVGGHEGLAEVVRRGDRCEGEETCGSE